MPELKRLTITRLATGIRFAADYPDHGYLRNYLGWCGGEWAITLRFTQGNFVHASRWNSFTTNDTFSTANQFLARDSGELIPFHISETHFDFTVPYHLIGEAGQYDRSLDFPVNEPQGPYSPWRFQGTVQVPATLLVALQ